MARRKGNLAEVIQTDVVGTMPLKTLAKVLQSKGRRGDTILAHITPKEAKKLKKAGGAGTTNPETGLPEFYGEEGVPSFDYSFTPDVGPTTSYSSPDLYGSYDPTTSAPTTYQFPGSVDTSGVIVAENPYQVQLAEMQTGQVPSSGYLPSAGLYDSVFSQPSQPVQQMTGLQPSYLDRGPQDIQAQIQAAAGGVGAPLGEKPATDIGAPATKAADTTGKTEEEKSTLEKLLSGKSALGLGILGAGGLMGYMNQQKAAAQAKAAAAQIQAAYQQAAQQQKDLAQPLIGPGYTQLSQALQGALSPANTQAFQAAQARAAQASARSGGVGAVQTALQEEALRQQLLASQQQQALNLIAPGNAMIQAAINAQLQGTTQSLGTRLQLEQQANQAAMNLYAALGSAVGGGILKG